MSRIAKKPIIIPKDISVMLESKNKFIFVKGNIRVTRKFNKNLLFNIIKNKISVNVISNTKKNWSYAGTTRSLLNNIILGIKYGFEKKLVLIGVGYKALVKENILFLDLGFSHTIRYIIPNGIIINCVSQTEILVKGYDKELVGQVSAYIRSYKKPEPYKKGKGIRYFNEYVRIKESKKKLSK